MTARADISNARRRKLEERSKASWAAYMRGEPIPPQTTPRQTAWEKGEAKPPFYREVLEEGVRRGDVVSKARVAELYRVIKASGDGYKELETRLREAEGRIERVEKACHGSITGMISTRYLLSILAGTERERDG